ncbi:MAG: response regulator [Planctomycetia bacterium]|nr:response regulator [Planctomycetia bacterium]
MSETEKKMEGEAETKTKVLVIDDDPEISESIRIALEVTGYDVVVARNGSAGLALAERLNPDLIILDMMMPKRSGFLVLETLRQTRKVPNRVIMITANEGTRHKDYAKELGVDEYIHKPFPMDVLLEAVVRVLHK